MEAPLRLRVDIRFDVVPSEGESFLELLERLEKPDSPYRVVKVDTENMSVTVTPKED